SAVITAASGLASVWATWLAADAVAAGQLDPLLAVPIALVPLTLAEALALLPPVAVHAPVLDSARRRLAELFDEQPPGSSAVRRTDDGTIELRSVTLRWPGAAEPALRDVRLRIEPGTHVAIVGPSGAGKSTLLAALAGLLPGEGGTAALPGSVALAPQDPQLISASVAENLRLGDPAADEDQLVSALRTARLPELADRLDLVLGSAGAGLSGGQARRLAIARALLAALRPGGPRVVLLDEPTAHLDRPTATALFDNLRTLLAGHTVVHVTHRPEEAAHADVVLEVRDGRVGPAASPVARRSEPATASSPRDTHRANLGPARRAPGRRAQLRRPAPCPGCASRRGAAIPPGHEAFAASGAAVISRGTVVPSMTVAAVGSGVVTSSYKRRRLVSLA